MTREDGNVFVVDDDEGVRRGLARLLMSVRWKVRTFASAAEFLQACPPPAPGCLILDIRMPGLNGLDLQSELSKRDIQTPIIFMTGHGDVPMAVRAMKGGAVDFLTKPFKKDALLATVRRALEQDAQSLQARTLKAAIQGRIESLTPREREVMFLVAQGKMNKEIADALGAAEATIKVHRGRVMGKMQVQSVAELVRAVERVGVAIRRSEPDNTKGL